MSSKEWRTDNTEDKSDRDIRFGDALAELAIDRAPEIDSVAAVRESRENV